MKVIGEEGPFDIEGKMFIGKDQLVERIENVSLTSAEAEDSEAVVANGDTREGADAAASRHPQQQVVEVASGLLLCAAPALSVERVARLGVTRVLSAAPELPDTPLPPGVVFQRVPLHDSPAADLATHLDDVADAILKERESGGTTLVHCVAGVSRSVALCLAFVVKHERVPLRKAFVRLRARRPCARPNSGFFRQLIDFELRTLGAASVAMVTHPDPAGGKPLCIPDVYESEYQATLWLRSHYPCSLGRH